MATSSLAIDAVPIQVTPPPGFQDLYQRHSDLVYRTALRVTGNPADAEDVLQTVFLRILNHQVLLDPDWHPERYLRRSATNASIDVIRRRTSQAESPLDESREFTSRESNFLLKERLRRAIAKLDAEDAELFVLCYVEGLSYIELAEQFRMEKATVATRLHRIRLALRKEIEK
jgi:RNA polymerase sigma-70 factor (ECF subfamily)